MVGETSVAEVLSSLLLMWAGHDVPGEGEHKIMEFIRLAKRSPGYQVGPQPAL